MLRAIYNYLYEWVVIMHQKLNIGHLINFSVITCCVSLAIVLMILITNQKENVKEKNVKRKYRWIALMFIFVSLIFTVNMIVNHNTLHWEMQEEYGNFDVLLRLCEMKYRCVNKTEWFRQLAEVTVYIPLGILLAKMFMRKIHYILGGTVLISVTIELLCGWFKFNTFYWQTLVCNVVGAIIGTGLAYVFSDAKAKAHNKKKYGIHIMPLMLCAVYFVTSYAFYYSKDYGNIYPKYYNKIKNDKLAVLNSKDLTFHDIILDDNHCSVSFSSDEIKTCAEKCFSMKGKKIDYSKTKIATEDTFGNMAVKGNIIYTDSEETVVFIARNWGFYFVDRQYYGDEFLEYGTDCKKDVTDENIEYDDIKSTLAQYGIEIKGEAKDNDREKNSIYYINDREIVDGGIRSIIIRADFFGKNELGMLKLRCLFEDYDYGRNSKKIYSDIVQPKQAYDKLCQGECYAEGLYEATQIGNVTITVNDYSLEVQRDNWGCLQYVYRFDIEPITVPDGTAIDRVFVPAMKSYYE